MIEELTKDIEFHQESLKLFGKLKAEYIFKDKMTRKQLTEIITFHQKERNQAQDEIRFCEKVIKKIDTPLILPDGQMIK